MTGSSTPTESGTPATVSSSTKAAMRNVVLIFREYSFIRVQVPPDKKLRAAIADKFTVHRRVTEKDRGKIFYTTEPEPCYEIIGRDGDIQQFYLMGTGFLPRLMSLLRRFGYKPNVVERKPAGIDDVMRLMPDRNVIREFNWRENQRQIIDSMISCDRGQYIAATGSGKSFCIRALFQIYSRARILVTTYSKAVLAEMHHKVTDGTNLDVGLYSSGKSFYGNRGMFVSLGSLHHFYNKKWDILVLDEKHEACTRKRLRQLIGVPTRKAFGLSAQEADRADNADMWAEAIFGPVRTRHSHKAAVRQADVVPVKVRWVDPDVRRFPDLPSGDVRLERLGIWRNERRNELVAKEAQRCVDLYGQTLVYVKTVEHAFALQKFLDCPVACGKIDNKREKQLRRQGVIDNSVEIPAVDERLKLQYAFGAGKVKLVIATSVWKRGVDFPQLAAVVRADASGSKEDAVQVTGRVTRKFEGKKFGIIVDFEDTFHESLKHRAKKRKDIYKREGYTDLK